MEASLISDRHRQINKHINKQTKRPTLAGYNASLITCAGVASV